MEALCSKFIVVKAGSKIITSTDTCEICEFELLQDLQVSVECNEIYSAEKLSVLDCHGCTEI